MKSIERVVVLALALSPSSRRAWIEIVLDFALSVLLFHVALLAEGVD